jgi:sortase (surface protein transpeptidase)
VRVVDAATAGPLDVSLAGGPVLAAGLAFPGAGGWSEVPAGADGVRVATAGGRPADVPVDLAAGSVTTLLVLDRPGGGLTLRPVLDAGGASVVPTGPVQAGGGGMADGSPAAALALGGAGALLVGVRPLRRVLAVVVLAGGTLAIPGPSHSSPAPAAHPVVVAAATARRTAVPVRLQIPTAGVDTALPAIGVDDTGALVPPADVATAGWFAEGAVPGEAGPAVIAGHVDSVRGPGVFFRLRTVAPGDQVLVTRADGSVVRFTVTRVARYPKAAFPTEAVYGPTPDAELRLVTCGGAFDRAARSYVDDVVVFARAA